MTRAATAGALGLLAVAWAATVWVDPWADQRVNDLFVYRQIAEPVLDGFLPYRDFAFEYPPLAVLAIVLPGLAGTGDQAYEASFAVFTLLLAGGLVFATARLARLTGGRPLLAALAVGASPLLLGALMRTHYDLLPVLLTVAALALVVGGRPRLGLAVLGAGVVAKGFPLVAAPPILAWLAARGQRRTAVEGALALAAVAGAVSLLALAASPSGALDAVEYHLERPVQVESTPALVLRGVDALGLSETTPTKSHRSDGLLHPASDTVTAAFTLLLLLVLGVLTRAVAREPEPRRMVLAALTATVAFAALGKVLSPQFAIWVVPLMALALAWRNHALAGAAAASLLLTFAEFPSRYFDLVAGDSLPLAIVAARDVALLVVLVLAGRELSSPAAEAARSPRRARPRPPRPAPR